MGLEALSRGSPRVVFLEKDRRVVKVLEENIAMLDAKDECEVVMELMRKWFRQTLAQRRIK